MRRAALALLLVGATVGCVSGREPTVVQPVAAESPLAAQWASTLAEAVELAESSRYGQADSVLARFATLNAASAEGAEALYWRALLLLDPANPTATPRDAILAIDAYLARGLAQPHYEELLLLRRAAGNLERIRVAAVELERARPEPPTDSAAVVLARQAEEIKQLRAELEKAQAELERLKKRVRP